MAKHKLSSKEVMDIIYSADEKIGSFEENIKELREELLEKQKNNQIKASYANNLIDKKRNYCDPREHYYILAMPTIPKDKNANIYGRTMFPKVEKEIDLLNFYTNKGYVFRKDVSLYIDGENFEKAKECLKHKSLQRFEYLDKKEESEFVLTIKVNEDRLHRSMLNAIAFKPSLPGSFEIKDITMGSRDKEQSIIKSGVKNAGSFMLLLEEEKPLEKINFYISLNDEMEYFGIEELRFLHLTKKSESVILEIEKEDYFHSMSEDIYIETFDEVLETTLQAKSIVAYSEYQNGVLGHEITPSRGNKTQPIIRNIKSIFLEIPYETFKNGIESIRFKNIQTRN